MECIFFLCLFYFYSWKIYHCPMRFLFNINKNETKHKYMNKNIRRQNIGGKKATNNKEKNNKTISAAWISNLYQSSHKHPSLCAKCWQLDSFNTSCVRRSIFGETITLNRAFGIMLRNNTQTQVKWIDVDRPTDQKHRGIDVSALCLKIFYLFSMMLEWHRKQRKKCGFFYLSVINLYECFDWLSDENKYFSLRARNYSERTCHCCWIQETEDWWILQHKNLLSWKQCVHFSKLSTCMMSNTLIMPLSSDTSLPLPLTCTSECCKSIHSIREAGRLHFTNIYKKKSSSLTNTAVRMPKQSIPDTLWKQKSVHCIEEKKTTLIANVWTKDAGTSTQKITPRWLHCSSLNEMAIEIKLLLHYGLKLHCKLLHRLSSTHLAIRSMQPHELFYLLLIHIQLPGHSQTYREITKLIIIIPCGQGETALCICIYAKWQCRCKMNPSSDTSMLRQVWINECVCKNSIKFDEKLPDWP